MDNGTRQTTQLTRHTGNVAPGWTRYTDELGITQYAPAERPSGAQISLARTFDAPLAQPYSVDVPGRQTVIHDTSSEVERSSAFVKFTIPLSLAMAGTTLLFAVLGGAGAVLAGALSFGGFAAVWLLALVYYVSRSPAGTARHDSNETWKLLREEQRFRHDAYWAHWERINELEDRRGNYGS